MDPITQGLLGATAAQTIGAKKIPNYAWKIGCLAGMAPDLDILIRSRQNPLLFFEYHRQFTHALSFIPFGGILVALFCLLIFKPLRSYKWLTVLAAVAAYGTHGLLDAMTSYGTVLLWPFNHIRYAWDIMPIIDPIFTFLLLGFLIVSVLKRSCIWAIMGLCIASSYIGFGCYQHHRAFEAQANWAKHQGQEITQARVMPTLGHLFAWRGVYLSKQTLYFTQIQTPLFKKVTIQPIMSRTQFRVESLPDTVKQSATLYNNFNLFAWFTDDYLFSVSSTPLILCDARYVLNFSPPKCMWGIKFPPRDSAKAYISFIRNIDMTH